MSGDRDHLLRSCSTFDTGLDMITRQNGGVEAGSYDGMIAATHLDWHLTWGRQPG